ncbi:cell wall hydrolase [Bacillus sp. 179-C3.3 HS]|uniref:cell wall hydrolase n=1 Tax=Bacillus sp. 179-C3.3 HS TaxID=3232162 RepID=UPI00399F7B09
MMKIHTALFVILMLVSAMKMDNIQHIQHKQNASNQEMAASSMKHQLSNIDQDEDQMVTPLLLDMGQQREVRRKNMSESKSSNQSQQKKEKAETKNEKKQARYSRDEVDLLSRLVHAEAKGESFAGKKAVASVVLNRVEHRSFPDSVKGVIYQQNAFQPVSNGSIHDKADRESIKAVKQVVKGQDRTTKAIYFYNPKTATDQWIRSRTVVEQIGRHVFAV